MRMTEGADVMPSEVWAGLQDLATGVGAEDNIARRLREELQRRGWSQETFAAKVREEGLRFPQSAISKILKPQGDPRAITVDEACAFARVLELPLVELLAPPEAAKELVVARALRDLDDLWDAHVQAEADLNEAEQQIIRFLERGDEGSALRAAILERLDRTKASGGWEQPYGAAHHLREQWEKAQG